MISYWDQAQTVSHTHVQCVYVPCMLDYRVFAGKKTSYLLREMVELAPYQMPQAE